MTVPSQALNSNPSVRNVCASVRVHGCQSVRPEYLCSDLASTSTTSGAPASASASPGPGPEPETGAGADESSPADYKSQLGELPLFAPLATALCECLLAALE